MDGALVPFPHVKGYRHLPVLARWFEAIVADETDRSTWASRRDATTELEADLKLYGERDILDCPEASYQASVKGTPAAPP